MKVAVSSNGKNLDARLDPRFGSCQFFLIVNPEDMSFAALNNKGAAQGDGAGIRTAQFLASQGVGAVITGNCGPNAVQTLSAAGIELFPDQAGTVKEVVERFKKGNLKPINEATVDSHFGINVAAGSGRGDGMGGGGHSKDHELAGLKQQADSLNRKMKEVISRINSLENR